MAFELWCVRHGRTAWNAEHRFQGQTDVLLDEEGRAQAQALAAFVVDDAFDAAVSSDLIRAVETARIVLGERTIALQLDVDLREMAFGDWEGRTWDEITALHPELLEEHRAQPKFYTPNGGESFDALCARVDRALDRVRTSAAPGSRILLATHAGVLHAIMRVLMGDESGALAVRFSPASLTQFSVGAKHASVLALNVVPERRQPTA